MGGYALYVWTSYGVALVVLGLNLILARRRQADVSKDIARALRQESLRRDAARPERGLP